MSLIKEGAVYLDFFASEINKVKLPDEGHERLYFIINLDSNVIKFGKTSSWKKRLKDHISQFVCYAQAKTDRLYIGVSCKPLLDMGLAEKFLIFWASKSEHFKRAAAKEFFVYLPANLLYLDIYFHGLVNFAAGEGSEEFLSGLRKPLNPPKRHKNTRKS
jgi:hypothetical protein